MKFKILLVAGLMLVTTAGQVDAAAIFSQTPTMNTGTFSDVDSIYRVADDFSIASAATARSITWQGFYFSNNSPQAVDDFTINFYSDAGGTVGGLIQSFDVGNAVNRTSGQASNVFTYYQYTADLGSGIALSAGTNYWVSIVNDTTVDPNDGWYWGTNTLSGNNKLSINGNWVNNGMTSYFILDNSNLNPVPEPASIAMWGAGAFGAFLVRRRRQNRTQSV